MNDNRLQYTVSFIASFSFNFRQVTVCTSGIENYFFVQNILEFVQIFQKHREKSLQTRRFS